MKRYGMGVVNLWSGRSNEERVHGRDMQGAGDWVGNRHSGGPYSRQPIKDGTQLSTLECRRSATEASIRRTNSRSWGATLDLDRIKDKSLNEVAGMARPPPRGWHAHDSPTTAPTFGGSPRMWASSTAPTTCVCGTNRQGGGSAQLGLPAAVGSLHRHGHAAPAVHPGEARRQRTMAMRIAPLTSTNM